MEVVWKSQVKNLIHRKLPKKMKKNIYKNAWNAIYNILCNFEGGNLVGDNEKITTSKFQSLKLELKLLQIFAASYKGPISIEPPRT